MYGAFDVFPAAGLQVPAVYVQALVQAPWLQPLWAVVAAETVRLQVQEQRLASETTVCPAW